jgi:hypothetical protein
VLRGTLSLASGAQAHSLHAGDACALPPRTPSGLLEPSLDLELLEVALAAS